MARIRGSIAADRISVKLSPGTNWTGLFIRYVYAVPAIEPRIKKSQYILENSGRSVDRIVSRGSEIILVSVTD